MKQRNPCGPRHECGGGELAAIRSLPLLFFFLSVDNVPTRLDDIIVVILNRKSRCTANRKPKRRSKRQRRVAKPQILPSPSFQKKNKKQKNDAPLAFAFDLRRLMDGTRADTFFGVSGIENVSIFVLYFFFFCFSFFFSLSFVLIFPPRRLQLRCD